MGDQTNWARYTGHIVYIWRKERRTGNACNWVIRRMGMQGIEECIRMAAAPLLSQGQKMCKRDEIESRSRVEMTVHYQLLKAEARGRSMCHIGVVRAPHNYCKYCHSYTGGV